jgi:hypothetical protein
MTQEEHAHWNADNYPGTLQLCSKCEEPTGHCEEDYIVDGDGNPHCEDCAIGCGLMDGDAGA